MFSWRIKAKLAVLLIVLAAGILGGAGAVPAQTQEYKLGAGDKLKVVVLAEPEFSGDYEVDALGIISVRMIGRVSVLGMTVAELENVVPQSVLVALLVDDGEAAGLELPLAFLDVRRKHGAGFDGPRARRA